MRIRFLHWLLLMIVFAPAVAAEKTYQIRIHRPDRVGDRFNIAAVSAIRSWSRYAVGDDAQQPVERVMAVELHGEAEILEADEKGYAVKMSCTVEKCTRIAGADRQEQELLPKGAVIIAEAGKPRTKLSLKEGELTPEQQYAISLVLTLSAPGAATADDVYNTGEPRAIGSTWGPSGEVVARDLKRWNLEVDAKDVSGSVKLNGIKTIDGVEYLDLSTHLKIDEARSTDPERRAVPEGMTSTGMSRETNNSILAPVDPALPHLRLTRVDSLKESAEGTVGPRQREARYQSVFDSTFELRVTPIEKQ